jgi:hypothetical protein
MGAGGGWGRQASPPPGFCKKIKIEKREESIPNINTKD